MLERLRKLTEDFKVEIWCRRRLRRKFGGGDGLDVAKHVAHYQDAPKTVLRHTLVAR